MTLLDLSERAGHKQEHLQHLHGLLNEFKCSNETCDYVDRDNTAEPLVPALTMPDGNIADESTLLPPITTADLPHCPSCGALLRPDVRWFGETLHDQDLERVDAFIRAEMIDLMLVVGTCRAVYPAAEYIYQARWIGARVAYVDIAPRTDREVPLRDDDWYFRGDVVDVIPRLLADVLEE
jgi:NAD-dependent SIR2 family protein deacetylase